MNPPPLGRRTFACTWLFFFLWLVAWNSARADSYTINLVEGWNLIANHLDNGSNTLEEIMPNPPSGTVFYKCHNSGETALVFVPGVEYVQGAGWGASQIPN